MPTMCDRRDCPNAAGPFRATILLMPAVDGYEGPPAQLSLGLNACDAHRETLGVDDFINEAGWAQIDEMFDSAGRVRPRRDNAGLVWVRL